MNRSVIGPVQHHARQTAIGTLATAPQHVPAIQITKIEVLVNIYSIALPFELKTKNPVDLNDAFAHVKDFDARLSHRRIALLDPTAGLWWTHLQTWDGRSATAAGRRKDRAPGRAKGRPRIPAHAGHRHSRCTPAPLRPLASACDAPQPHHVHSISPFLPCGQAPHMHFPFDSSPTGPVPTVHLPRRLPALQTAA